jgi:CheY-like chemotaxis protein
VPSLQTTDRERPTVLVVEDDDDSRENLVDLLEDEGFAVHAARNGVEALDYLAGATCPAAMVLDLQMPRMGGLELLSRVRAKPELQELPVCVLSGAIPDREVPAQLVVEKPLIVSRLVELQRWLSHCVEALH